MLYYKTGDIVEAQEDIVVNAANGICWMGGILSRIWKFSGISECINYATRGKIEKEMRKDFKIRKPGQVFFTNGYGIGKIGMIHAVTMLLPGTRSSEDTIQQLLPAIMKLAEEKGAHSVAMPFMGCGTGKLNKDRVKKIYDRFFCLYAGKLDVYIYDLK